MSVDDRLKTAWEGMQTERGRMIETEASLQFGGGDGTSGGMNASVTLKDYVDARDEAIETRLFSKLDKLPTKSTIWGAMGTAVAIMLAVAAFAGDRFDGGMSASGIVGQMKDQQATKDKAQDAKLDQIDGKLDVLIKQTAEPKR